MTGSKDAIASNELHVEDGVLLYESGEGSFRLPLRDIVLVGEYTTPDGPEESIADLAMDKDGTISGSLTSKRGTASLISGYLSVDKFSFTINIPLEGSPADVTFSGTFDGTSLKGSISVHGISLDFTGVKPTTNSFASTAVLGGAQ